MRYSFFSVRLTAEVTSAADAELRYWSVWLNDRPGFAFGHNPRIVSSLEQDLWLLRNSLNRLQCVAIENGELSETAQQYSAIHDQLSQILHFLRSLQTRWRGSPYIAQQLICDLDELRDQISAFCVVVTGSEPVIVEARRSTKSELAPLQQKSGSGLLTIS